MSNVIKGNYGYSFQDDDTRVIDTNSLIARKLEELSRVVTVHAASDEEFKEGFTQGIDAIAVEKLLDDPAEHEEGESNVIKAASVDEEQIRARTEELIADANNKAQDIVTAAQNEAQSIREEARQSGHKEGYDDGFLRGQQEAKAEYDDKMASLEIEKKRLEKEYEDTVAALEPKFVEVFTEVYEHVFHVNLSRNKEIIFYLIQNALRKTENNKNFIIHVSKEDYGFVSMQKKELTAGIVGGETVEIVEDMTLKSNECFIDTGGGIFDCSLETQLEGLKRELRLLSFTMDDGA